MSPVEESARLSLRWSAKMTVSLCLIFCDRNAGDCGHVLRWNLARPRPCQKSVTPAAIEDSGTVGFSCASLLNSPPPEIIGINKIDSERLSREAVPRLRISAQEEISRGPSARSGI